MIRWVGIFFGTLRSSVRTHRELALENLALRQQLAVWKAREPRPRLTEMDRIFWVLLSRLWASWRHALQVEHERTCRLAAPGSIESLAAQARRQMLPFELYTMARRAVLPVSRVSSRRLSRRKGW